MGTTSTPRVRRWRAANPGRNRELRVAEHAARRQRRAERRASMDILKDSFRAIDRGSPK